MITPWGDLTVSDAHVHFFSQSFFASLAQQKSGASVDDILSSLGWEAPGGQPELLAARWQGELDRVAKNCCPLCSRLSNICYV